MDNEFNVLAEECRRLRSQVSELNASINKLRKKLYGPAYRAKAQPLADDVLILLFRDGPLKYHQFHTLLKDAGNFGHSKAKEMIRHYLKTGKIVRDGRDRSPKTRYRLP